ncbi:catalase [Tetragenococcus halophilus subsp. halophilus]|uniref:Catalase n=1 Tax=Tetragenococcus halophilus subsp. halophilus TaxID=1513897 RepID=A0A2H6CRZ8_TETHA|nr:catalase [Tetragenococcus halophilus subsp. halophilus]
MFLKIVDSRNKNFDNVVVSKKSGGDFYMEKDPMAKNGLDSYQSSRNQNVGNNPELQTNAGAPVFNNDNTMTAGERGPSML